MKFPGVFKKFKRVISLSGILFFMIMSSSCVSKAGKQASFDSLFSAGRYVEAGNIGTDVRESKPSGLLESLQAATALRYAGEYLASSSLFDECENIIKYQHEQITAVHAASDTKALLVNDTVLDYRCTEYDGIMVNTYKALNFWQAGKKDLARVEFNRALNRQQRAKERFSTEISKLREEIRKEEGLYENSFETDVDRGVRNPDIKGILEEKYSNLYEFKAYPDFINPFTTYIAGLFFISEGDYSKACALLKETYGMVEENSVVLDDFLSAEGILEGRKRDRNYTWIIFENGLGPEKEEFRIALPVMLHRNRVQYITEIALPRLKFRDQACSHLIIKNNGRNLGQTSMLASIDRIVRTEFRKRYKLILTKAVASALIKTYGQYMAQKNLGYLGYFAAALYQNATTAADTRIWSALPKEFQVAKIETPDNGRLLIQVSTGKEIDITVSQDRYSLIYIRIPSSYSEIVYDVINF